jgi:hypothetical protein
MTWIKIIGVILIVLVGFFVVKAVWHLIVLAAIVAALIAAAFIAYKGLTYRNRHRKQRQQRGTERRRESLTDDPGAIEVHRDTFDEPVQRATPAATPRTEDVDDDLARLKREMGLP